MENTNNKTDNNLECKDTTDKSESSTSTLEYQVSIKPVHNEKSVSKQDKKDLEINKFRKEVSRLKYQCDVFVSKQDDLRKSIERLLEKTSPKLDSMNNTASRYYFRLNRKNKTYNKLLGRQYDRVNKRIGKHFTKLNHRLDVLEHKIDVINKQVVQPQEQVTKLDVLSIFLQGLGLIFLGVLLFLMLV